MKSGSKLTERHLPSPAAALPSRRVLVADDDETTREQLQKLLENSLGVQVDIARDGTEAMEALLERRYSIVLTDLRMPHVDGLQLIEEVQRRGLPVTVIVTTGHGSVDDAVQAMRMGAHDFLTKPLDFEHLRLVIRRALEQRALQDEVASLREQLQDRYAFQGVLSKSPRMHTIFELIRHVAPTTTTVLIQGETGTGKEVIARAIHQSSSDRKGPLVAVNCAALPENLLESEFFGHEKGSFTGAGGQRKGRFELAHGGTLFLDEVGDVPATMQVKLLRVLQERRFERVGGTQPVEVDVRVVAATNRPLRQMIAEGKFREDLYYRLNVVKIDLPSLRERMEDIPLLVDHFCTKYAGRGGVPKQIAPEAMKVLLSHRWPGNIRELENAIERGSVTSAETVIQPQHLPPELTAPPRRPPIPVDIGQTLTNALREVAVKAERRYLRKALRKSRGHLGRCAQLSGLSQEELKQRLAAHQLDPAEFLLS